MKRLALLALVLFIAGCAAQSFVCPDGSIVEEESQCPEPAAPEHEQAVDAPEPAPEEIEEELTLSDTVVDLKEKAAKVQSYAFLLAELPEKRATDQYYVRGNFVKVELYMGNKRKPESVDTVFLDLANKKAVGYCITGSNVVCSDRTKIIDRPAFEDYYTFSLPQEFMAEVTNAEDAGSVTRDGQSSKIFTTFKDGKDVRVTAMSYFGIPLLIEVYGSDDYTGDPSGYDFRDMSINTVKEADVTPPSGW